MIVPRIAIVVFGLAAYASASVLARSRSERSRLLVHPVESVLVLVAIAGVGFGAVVRPNLGFTFLSGLLLFLGGLITGRFASPAARAGTREFETNDPRGSVTLTKRWAAFSRSVADYEVRLFLSICYLLIISPLALMFRLAQPRRIQAESMWADRADAPPSLETARRLF